tara:strand:- start:9871 stop:10458 length:588 start_codon:yes stop_codon:yes gene_type:complete
MPFKSKRKRFMGFIKKLKDKIKSKILLVDQDKQFDNSILTFEKVNTTQIRFKWNIDTYYKSKLLNPKVYCLGIRIYDITSGNSKINSTCIMKEIEVNKNTSEYIYNFLLDNGIYLIELGYRSSNGKWLLICSSEVNLGFRKNQKQLIDDSWFYLSKSKIAMPKSLHERLYRLSKSIKIGGSELIKKKSNIKGHLF